MNPTLLRLQHIDFSYHTLHGETKALSDVSFTVTEGEFLATSVLAAAANRRSFP